ADGWQVAYLGADTPLRDTVDFAQVVGARIVAVSASTAERVGELAAELERAPLPRGMKLVVGGAGFAGEQRKALGAAYVNGDLRRAVRELRKLGA
ncbi:MAG TPA: cobalamin-dependent protein, partial [Gaiellaceae bacterium]|nr:cobalamin-dependent protein [Gaiellaceae bacterium]